MFGGGEGPHPLSQAEPSPRDPASLQELLLKEWGQEVRQSIPLPPERLLANASLWLDSTAPTVQKPPSLIIFTVH